MNILFIPIEIALQLLASWTLAYHLFLLTRLPARLIIIPFLLIFCPLAALSWPRWRHASGHFTGERWFLLGAVGLALVTGAINLIGLRPHSDDFFYFHRPLTQLQHLALPFITTETAYNIPDLPPLSVLHVTASYEPLVAMTAALINVEPLAVYHNISAFIAAALLPVVYILLYRQFRLNQALSLMATMFALIFLILDGKPSRSFGMIALVRLWEGKTVLWALLIPMTFLVAHRFLSYPTWGRFSLVVMAGICAVGLSGSGAFLIPTLIFGISLAYLLSYGFSRIHLKRAIILNLASFYCVVITVGLLSGLLPQPDNTAVWAENQWWPPTWWPNLQLVIGDQDMVIRDLIILLGLPLIGLTRPMARFPVFFTATLILIFANPLLGPVWMKLIYPASYWRLAYLFPLPWCAGLIAGVFRSSPQPKIFFFRVAVAVAVVLATVNAYQSSIFNQQQFKAPWEYRLAPAKLAFARSVSDRLQHRNLLAPADISIVLGLVNPTIKFEATNSAGTLHTFRNAGTEAEGQRRVVAQELVTNCRGSPEAETALLQSLERGVNAIIIKDCGPSLPQTIENLKNFVPGQWEAVEHNNGYVLLLRRE